MPKTVFVSAITPASPAVSEFFAVQKCEIKAKKGGGSYLAITLADKTGTIEGRMWDNIPAEVPIAGNYVKVAGTVDEYRGKAQLKVTQMRFTREDDVIDLRDFLPASTKDLDQLYRDVGVAIASLENTKVRDVLQLMWTDFKVQVMQAPAAMKLHHAYIGGLLEHIHSLVNSAIAICDNENYKLDRSMMVAAAVLHDIAKIVELQYDTALNYTTKGRMWGHVYMGSELVRFYCRKMQVPPELELELVHLVLSHHGEKAMGAPVLPATREAVVFHYLDQIDAKMQMFDEAIKTANPESDFTDRIWALGNAELYTK